MSHVQTERENETLVEAALRVLNTADPFEKARQGDSVASKWLQGTITRPYNPSQDLPVSDRPARLTNVKLVSPSLMPKLGKAGSLQSRQAIVHSLVHTESWAIDLSWARGLDVLPTTISRFRNGGDDDTADLLERVVYPEEITHCAAGVKWFKYLCLRSRNPSLYQDILALEESEAGRSETQMDKESEEVIHKFHAIVRTHFRGPLKPPFNEKARKAAGFGPQWYDPLAVKGPASQF